MLAFHHTLGKTLAQLLPLNLWHFSTFLWMLTAVLMSRSVSLAQWSAQLPFDVLAASTERRFHRWLHNDRIAVHSSYVPIFVHAMGDAKPERIILALDTSMLRDRFCVVMVSMIHRGRGIPVAWKVLEHESSSVGFEHCREVLDRARELLPEGVPVVLLADRGFAGKKLMRFLNGLGWIWHIRIKGNQILHFPSGKRSPRELSLRKGEARLYDKAVDFGAGLQQLSLCAGWPRRCSETWYVLSNEAAHPWIFADYALRFDIEEMFRDEKSGGFALEKSRIESPEALERLIFVIATATIVAVSEGLIAVEEGHRREIDSHWKRGLSYFQIGLRWIWKALCSTTRKIAGTLRLASALDDSLPVAPTKKEALRRLHNKEPMCLFESIMHCYDLT